MSASTIPIQLDSSGLADEDAALVLAAQRNPDEFKHLYTKWLKRVYRYFYFRVDSASDAEDLTAQVFLKAYEDLPRYRNRSRFSAWLFAIAHARVVDHYRRQRRNVPLEAIEQVPGALDLSDQAARKDEIRQVAGLLHTLPEDEQELIRLRFMAELSYHEIGLILDRSEEAVRKSISRLLDRMQTQLEEHHD